MLIQKKRTQDQKSDFKHIHVREKYIMREIVIKENEPDSVLTSF